MTAADAAEQLDACKDASTISDHADRRQALGLLEARVAPAVPAHERGLPLLEEVAGLFPSGFLRRGSTVSIKGPGSTALSLAVAAGPSAAGSWLGVVGDPGIGWSAASEIGIDLARVLVVDPEPQEWSYAIAALIGSVDLILLAASRRIAERDARRLAARARERGSVLICRGDQWPRGADVWIEASAGAWQGIGDGQGPARSRRLRLRSGGRAAAARPRSAEILLPGPAGAAASVDSGPAGRVAVLERADPADGPTAWARA